MGATLDSTLASAPPQTYPAPASHNPAIQCVHPSEALSLSPIGPPILDVHFSSLHSIIM